MYLYLYIMYTFSIKDYHAIEEAIIRVNGITVLAGINGSGKSTLSRWLYYLVNATREFEQFQRRYFIDALIREVEKVSRFFRPSSKYSNYASVKRQLRHFTQEEELDWDGLRSMYYAFVEKAENDLREYAGERPRIGRLGSFLLERDIPEDMPSQDIINTYLQGCSETFEKGLDKYMRKVESYRKEDLVKVIASEFSDGEQMPANISLSEGEAPLLEEETFTPPLMLNRAIYVDTPMAVTKRGYSVGNDIWDDFVSYLYRENKQRESVPTEFLDIQIQTVIGGKIQLAEDNVGLEHELHFVSKEQGIDIDVKDAATGVKTFAYMAQLLRNGWLDNKTLLMIDEPEAHLHPQWIVEFARLLVRIHKELGVKVLVASHNPDMVAAIQSIAQKEEVIDKTVFYLAQREKDNPRYVFSDKGAEISDIFTSFNIALSRIEQYGNSMM